MIYFNLFANCILTKGINRSVITDIQNKQIYFIDNEIFDLLFELEKNPILNVLNVYDDNAKNTIEKYIAFLIKENLGFYCNNASEFPKINEEFHASELVNNCIIDYTEESVYDFKKIINNLNDLKCKFLQIRSYSELPLKVIFEISELINIGYFRNVDIILKYKNDERYLSEIEKIIRQNRLIGEIMFHTSPNILVSKDLSLEIKYTKEILSNEKCCGVINKKYFSIDIKTHMESKKHNTCLNNKISIDISGNIKNCPSMPQSFGNIKDTTLEEALNHPDFKKYWNVNKDMIEVCKDCEFRHICTDCRAYTERNHFDGELDLSKPLKCGYNPYTSEWAEWSINPLKENGIEYYGMQDLIKKDV